MIRKVGLALLVLALLVALYSQRAELGRIAGALAHAQPGWALAALGASLAYMGCMIALHRASFRTVGASWSTQSIGSAWLRSLVVNLSVPGTGTSMLLAESIRSGIAPGRASAALLLVRVADLAMLGLSVLAGLGILGVRGLLRPVEWLAAGGLVLLLGVWGSGLFLARFAPERLARLLTFVEKLAKGRLPEGWGKEQAGHAQESVAPLFTSPARLLLPLALALGAHLSDLTCLYFLTRAFDLSVSSGTVLAAFSIGLLFWCVSLTPDGIGAVEGMMSVVFISLGVPAPQAVAVVLAFRGFSLWLPVACGLIQTLARVQFPERLTQKLLAAATAAMGLINLVSATLPALVLRRVILWHQLPLEVRHGSRLASALAGFALLLLAQGLLRRKKLAHTLTLAALFLSVVTHLTKGLDWEEATLALVLFVALYRSRQRFVAQSDGPTMQQGAFVLLGALLFTLTYGVIGLWLLDRHFSEDFGFRGAVEQTLAMFFSFQDHGLVPRTRFGAWFADSIYFVAAGSLSFALLSFLRPVLLRRNASPAERARARAIIERYGCSSLARFALLTDKLYWFSPGGSVVAYALAGRTAVALGDAMGPESDIPAALAGFLEFCRENDWDMALYQTLPDHLETFKDLRLEVICIGSEAIIDLTDFTLDGKAGKGMRNKINRIRRDGWTTEVVEAPHTPELLNQLRAISDDWLKRQHGGEKRFSLGWFDEEYLQDAPIIIARGPDGEIGAFANLVPEYALNELTIDLMRQHQNADPGVMDFLLIELMFWGKEKGYDSFNLGLAPLAGVGEERGDPPRERALNLVYRRGGRFYSFEGLRTYKMKFHPRWEPRYLVYTGSAALPRAAAAVVRADNPALLTQLGKALKGLR
ncbi:MAG: flippase-like domain-containing protein [Armatimonas sp.]